MAKRTPKKDLPDIPSEILQCSMEDVRVINGNSDYIFNMDVWHQPEVYMDLGVRGSHKRTGRCSVCVAGSTIANRLGMTPGRTIDELKGLSADTKLNAAILT